MRRINNGIMKRKICSALILFLLLFSGGATFFATQLSAWYSNQLPGPQGHRHPQLFSVDLSEDGIIGILSPLAAMERRTVPEMIVIEVSHATAHIFFKLPFFEKHHCLSPLALLLPVYAMPLRKETKQLREGS